MSLKHSKENREGIMLLYIIYTCLASTAYVSTFADRKCSFLFHYESDITVNVSSPWDVYMSYLVTESSTDCYIDVSEMFGNLTKTMHKEQINIDLIMSCQSVTRVHFKNEKGQLHDKNISLNVDLRVDGCSLHLDELSLFQHFGSMYVLSLTNCSVFTGSNCSIIEGLKQFESSLLCDYSSTGDLKSNKFFWEDCKESFESLVMLNIHGCKNYSLNGSMLETKFPNVQALQLHSVEIRSTLRFPWTDVPKGNGSGPSNRFDLATWTFCLEGLDIFPENLVNLEGDIDYVVISNVSAESFPKDLFWNVTGMTRLDLSTNALIAIDPDLLRNQVKMEDLHLNKNMLSHLDSRTFQFLHNVGFLDLSYNLITEIDSQLLSSLIALEELHLEHNLIETLPKHFLEKQMPTIKEVYLQYNKIKTIPVFPLYAKHLQLLKMNHCPLDENSLVRLVEHLSFLDTIVTLLDGKASDPDTHLQNPVASKAIIDVSYCQIKDLSLSAISSNGRFMLVKFLQFFQIDGTGNPVDCSCAPLSQEFNWDWKCMYPRDLRGRNFKSVTLNEMRCPWNFTNCPEKCHCYIRLSFKSKIIDCRNTNMTDIPFNLPDGYLELWFQNSSITSLTPRKYFQDALVLDFSHNKLAALTASTITSFSPGLKSLMLNSNHLTSLPEELRNLNVSKMRIGNNLFICDCHTKWMKKWLLERTSPVIDWNEVKCTFNLSKAQQLISVPDYMFICQNFKTSPFSVAQHIIFPSTIIGSFLFVLVTLSLTIYFQRFTVKVLLYMYTGCHPFDKLRDDDSYFEYDAYVIYTEETLTFAQEKLVNTLRENRYRVADFTRTFVIGLSFMDNMERLILKSKRIIFCMSDNATDNALIMTGWNIAYQRAVEGKMNSVIIVTRPEFRKHCTEESMKKFLRTGTYIKENAKLLLEKVIYLMPNTGGDEHIELENTERIINGAGNRVNYIMCPVEDDNNLYQEVYGQLVPYLREHHQNIEDFENAFLPGTDLRDEMDEMLERSQHFIFILTPGIIGNEVFEVAMFILSTIISKSKLSGYNYLLLIINGDLGLLDIPGDLKSYMDTFVTCDYNDPDLKQYLFNSLTYCRKNVELDETEASNTEIETNTRIPLI